MIVPVTMKLYSNIRKLAFHLFTFAILAPFVEGADVIVIAGQSNAWNLGQLGSGSTVIAPHKVHYYTRGCVADAQVAPSYTLLTSLDPNSSGTDLVKGMVDELGEDVVVVHLACCGSPISSPGFDGGARTWYPGDDPQAGQFFSGGICAKFVTFYGNAKSHYVANNPGETWNLKAVFWHYQRGPYPVYSFKEKGRTVSRRLHSAEEVSMYRQQIQDDRRFQQVVSELLKVGEQLSDAAARTAAVKKTPHTRSKKTRKSASG
jgi:hypothetical protein